MEAKTCIIGAVLRVGDRGFCVAAEDEADAESGSLLDDLRGHEAMADGANDVCAYFIERGEKSLYCLDKKRLIGYDLACGFKTLQSS